jgi:hypothetical protein
MEKENLSLQISPINPFTKRQAQIAELKANGYKDKQIAVILGISRQAVKRNIIGSDSASSLRFRKGIYGIIEDAGKLRPYMQGIVTALLGDVLFFNKRPPDYKVILLDRTRKQIIADLRRRRNK